MKHYKDFIAEAKVSETNLEKAVAIFVKMFERKSGHKLYRFGGPSGYTQIRNGKGILFFYNRVKAIQFNYIAGSIDSLTLWDSYKLGKPGDLTIDFSDVGLMKAGQKLLDLVLNKMLKAGDEVVFVPEINESTILTEGKRISPTQAALMVLDRIPPGMTKTAVTWSHISDTILNAGYSIPTAFRSSKSTIRGRFDLTKFLSEPGADKPSKSYEPEYRIKVTAGDRLSLSNPAIGGDQTAKTASTEIKNVMANPDVKKEMSDPTTLFGIMKNLVQLVCRKSRNALVIYGGPGTGKTYTVLETLKSEGKQKNRDFYIVKGKITTSELYRTLFLHRDDKIIVFDDTDSLWNDADASNILKAALDSYEERTISWFSPRTMNLSRLSDEEKETYYQDIDAKLDDPEEAKGVKMPSEFPYNGRIIFISNLPYHKFDSAVLTRSAKIDMTLTQEQMFKRMEGILPHLGDKNVPISTKKDILQYLVDASGSGDLVDVSMRTFTAAEDLYKSGLPNGKDLLAYI